MKSDPRARAAKGFAKVWEGQPTDRLGYNSPLEHELLLGCVRHYYSLSARVDRFLDKPIRNKDLDVRGLLLIGVYQLLHTRIPDHAAIAETVGACTALRKPWARRLVNGVLRNVQRHTDDWQPDGPEQTFDLPAWLVARVQDQYSDSTALLTALNQRAPMSLRINTRKVSPANYQATLASEGIAFQTHASAEALTLEKAIPQADLPGYADGLVSVQDFGAQAAARLLAVEPTHRLLDACAAPGGKLFHVLEAGQPQAANAVEASANRAAVLISQAERLGHTDRFEIYQADARDDAWWDGKAYDRVLIDAPCSGVGTLRRHPDIKLHRSAEQLEDAAHLQLQLLVALWPKLKQGGRLLYCTCSLLEEENDQVINAFISQTPDAQLLPVTLTTGCAREHGWQLLPTDPLTDGFYFALLTKTSGQENLSQERTA